MKKTKHKPWNKGLAPGQRDAFTRSEVKEIRKMLANRFDAGLAHLAMFSTAIDTMLRSPDLLALTVKDVRKRNGVMRDSFKLEPNGRRSVTIQCSLSPKTMDILQRLITETGKYPGDYLFTGRVGGGSRALSSRHYIRLVKSWVIDIGLDGTRYGIESMRRTRATYILNRTGNLEAVRALLGLSNVGKTALYICDTRPVNALAIARAHVI